MAATTVYGILKLRRMQSSYDARCPIPEKDKKDKKDKKSSNEEE
jgi:hypothetical protein